MDMRPLFDEAETQRQQQLRDQFVRDYRARWHAGLLRRFFGGVRRIFLFLLAAAIVTFIIWRLNEIDSVAAQKITSVASQVQSQHESDPLRQSALNYEKEVEEAAR